MAMDWVWLEGIASPKHGKRGYGAVHTGSSGSTLS